ncbi:MAG TPA: adenylate/guanylate cyclase domain-containing protein [Candidatus Limnocylindria bacterium]|nr:adenylate/guanylate cyclase domain-containing protein [Candidatus Limnocylindria bacterium]
MFSKRQRRQRAVVAGLAALAVLFGAFALLTQALDTTLQTAIYDKAIDISPAQVKNQITIVAVDDLTIRKYDVYPLPRRAYAELITALKAQSPTVIAMDISFYDRSPSPEDDALLAAAIKDAGNVILAMQGAGDAVLTDHSRKFAVLQLPIAQLGAAAAGVGSVNVTADPDSRVRDAQLRIEGPDGTTYYALPLLAAARQVRADLTKATVTGDRLIIPAPLGERVMPLDQAGGMAVYYASKPATSTAKQEELGFCKIPGEFCVVSMKDVIAGAVPRDLIVGRTVFVGFHSVSAVPDDYPVPNSIGRKMFGVEIWANTAQSIFTNRYPVLKQGFFTTLVQLLIVTLIGMLLVVRWRLWGFLGALGVFAAYIAGAYILFATQTQGVVGNGPVEVPSMGYVIPSAFWWVIALGYLLFEEQRAVSRTQSTFGRFVTPAVARTIMDREETGQLALGGEDRRVTVLFGDIRGFTTISEGMTPAILLGHLNRYFDGMVNIVNRYEGSVNKYNGDNIMVIWGAPIEVADEARKAVECALEMQKWIQAERAKGGPDVSFGFGINTGHVVAGFLGAMGRMEYTVIGDTANVASRLTSADIARRDQVACSAETLGELGDDVDYVDLGAIHVKGRAEPVACYQINRIGALANPNAAPAMKIAMSTAVAAGSH